MARKPPRGIVWAARSFSMIWMYLGSPDGAVNNCGRASAGFIMDYARVVKRPCLRGLHRIELRGSRKHFPRQHLWHWRYSKLKDVVHVVVRVGDWTIDFTRRQFDWQCPHPFIQHIDDVRAEWTEIRRLKRK